MHCRLNEWPVHDMDVPADRWVRTGWMSRICCHQQAFKELSFNWSPKSKLNNPIHKMILYGNKAFSKKDFLLQILRVYYFHKFEVLICCIHLYIDYLKVMTTICSECIKYFLDAKAVLYLILSYILSFTYNTIPRLSLRKYLPYLLSFKYETLLKNFVGFRWKKLNLSYR
jgi:hypothetical protein